MEGSEQFVNTFSENCPKYINESLQSSMLYELVTCIIERLLSLNTLYVRTDS